MTNPTDFVSAYIRALLWSTLVAKGQDPVVLDHAERYNLSADARTKCIEDVGTFIRDNIGDLTIAMSEGFTMTALMHDLALTRNRHGAGFWDRGLGVVGERLTAAAHAMGGVDLYLGRDALLHIG